MKIEELVEAHLARASPDVPSELQEEFEQATAAYEALQYALGETIHVPQRNVDGRLPPLLSDDYEIVKEIGRGGMGVVYLARQMSLGRNVAVKVLRPGETTFGPIVERFKSEAKHLARLRHPNIVSIHEVGEAGGEPFFTMDFIEGESLSEILRAERLSPSHALSILKQVAEGVRHAHENGIIHRDLKPGNVLIDAEGQAFVTDFGLARDLSQQSNLTYSGEIVGTPAYMAPEQAQGQAELIGEATDIHALGMILYEMIVGKPPYGNDAPANVLVRLLKEDPVPPREVRRGVPRDLETICLKAMAKQPDRRYHNVNAFLEDLNRYESGEAVLARRPGPAYHAVRFLRRQWKITTAVAVTALILLSIAPQMFDKSVQELKNWGDERHAAGDYAGAVSVYGRALTKATEGEQVPIARHLIESAKQVQDPQTAVKAARMVVDFLPNEPFGKLDLLIAQSIVVELRAANANRSLLATPDEKLHLLRIAEKRLECFLDSEQGNETQRKDAAATLALVQRAIHKKPVNATPRDPYQDAPVGTPDELLTQAANSTLNPWQRGLAARAAGAALENAGNRPAALNAYRTALELMRSVYPTYKGVTSHVNFRESDLIVPDTEECGMLRDVLESVKRLDPARPDEMGGIRFRVEGVRIPKELSLSFHVTLCDPEIAEPDRGFYRNDRTLPGRFVPIGRDQIGYVSVADGTYRLEIRDGMRSTSDESAAARRTMSLIQFDYDSLPSEVNIQQNTTELIVPAWMLAEIDVVAPEAGAPMDLREDSFRWKAVAHAAYYRVTFLYSEPGADSSYVGIGTVRASIPLLRLGELSGEAATKLREHLIAGRIGWWTIAAFDTQARRIAVVPGNALPFLVARDLRDN